MPSGISGNQLHFRVPEAHVEGAGVRGVRQRETDDRPARDRKVVFSLSTCKHRVPEPSHECMIGFLLAIRHRQSIIEQNVIEHDDFLTIHRIIEIAIFRNDPQIAIETHVLLQILADVRVVPEHSFIRHFYGVDETLPRFDGLLRDACRAIELVFQTETMPVNRRRNIDVIFHVHREGRSLFYFEQRPGDLAVIRIHRKLLSIDGVAHKARIEGNSLTVIHFDNSCSFCLRKFTKPPITGAVLTAGTGREENRNENESNKRGFHQYTLYHVPFDRPHFRGQGKEVPMGAVLRSTLQSP